MQDAGAEQPGFFIFTHIYRCRGPGSVGWDAAREACVFEGVKAPKVQVLDNWGWCNGTCEKNADGSDRGCYNDPNGTKQCESDSRAWTPYDGRIILKP